VFPAVLYGIPVSKSGGENLSSENHHAVSWTTRRPRSTKLAYKALDIHPQTPRQYLSGTTNSSWQLLCPGRHGHPLDLPQPLFLRYPLRKLVKVLVAYKQHRSFSQKQYQVSQEVHYVRLQPPHFQRHLAAHLSRKAEPFLE
jgi:hypothetical protein